MKHFLRNLHNPRRLLQLKAFESVSPRSEIKYLPLLSLKKDTNVNNKGDDRDRVPLQRRIKTEATGSGHQRIAKRQKKREGEEAAKGKRRRRRKRKHVEKKEEC